MLPRTKRVSKEQFPAATSRKQTRISPFFSLTHSPTSEKARFACVVSKKVATLATERNQLRRRVYVICGEAAKDTLTGIVVIYAKKDSAKIPFTQMKAEISALLKNL